MIHVDRAGTRVFRSPELLLHSAKRGTALDTWSAGIILISILTHIYPFSEPEDDKCALAELINIVGLHQVENAAKRMKISFNIRNDDGCKYLVLV